MPNETQLDDARRAYEKQRDETKKLWRAFSEEKARVEADGAKAAGVADLETSYYAPYERSAGLLKVAEERYRSLLEQLADADSTVTTGEATEFLRNVKASALGDHGAHARLLAESKGWIEGTDASGGFMVSPTVLPGYLPALRASSPLRFRCNNVSVSSNEVWLVAEGDSITVEFVPEAGTKPDSTGTVAQKVSTVHKVAGVTHVSDELLADSNGMAAELVSSQFAKSIGIAIDTAIIDGSGTGEPTGIRNTVGVTSTAVDGQTGKLLSDSIIRAAGRLAEDFVAPDTLVIHPRDFVKFGLATDLQGRYLFERGLAGQLEGSGITVVADANMPDNLGTGTDETEMILGNFAQGAYFFSRTPLVVEASRDAGWITDETVFRGVERFGFAVVRPTAFEILTGIEP